MTSERQVKEEVEVGRSFQRKAEMATRNRFMKRPPPSSPHNPLDREDIDSEITSLVRRSLLVTHNDDSLN